MCCSTGPAKFSKSKVGTNPFVRGGRTAWFYQNNALNMGAGANSMLLAFPAEDITFINTEKFPNIVGDMARPCEASLAKALNLFSTRGGNVERLEIVGPYEIAVCHDIRMAVKIVTEMVSPNKRPTINWDLIVDYDRRYSKDGWIFAFFCWAGSEMVTSLPILGVGKSTLKPGYAFLPSLDAHTGYAPDEGFVDVDATYFLGTGGMAPYKLLNKMVPVGMEVAYTDSVIPNNVKPLLPRRVVGQKIDYMLKNGDTILDLGIIAEDHVFSERAMIRSMNPDSFIR